MTNCFAKSRLSILLRLFQEFLLHLRKQLNFGTLVFIYGLNLITLVFDEFRNNLFNLMYLKIKAASLSIRTFKTVSCLLGNIVICHRHTYGVFRRG